MKRLLIILSAVILTMTISAQQINTLFFLENAPMRHTINPALQPVSAGYVNFSPLGWMSTQGGNSLSLSDVIYTKDGQTITALHPNGDKEKLLKAIKRNSLIGGSGELNILSFGFRYKKDPKGYIHIGIRERMDGGVNVPKSMADFLLGGLMTDLDGVNTFSMKGLNAQVQLYTEIAGGYSYKLNEKWTVGGKVKILLGQAYIGETAKDLSIDMSKDEWVLHGDGKVYIAAPINYEAGLPRTLNYNQCSQMKLEKLLYDNYAKLAIPTGYGAAVDAGFTYKPAKWVQISAALNDLGFVYWDGFRYGYSSDTTFTGVGELQYGDYVRDGKFQGDSLLNQIGNRMLTMVKGLGATVDKQGFARMLTTTLNVGADFNFCNNMLGAGVLSSTKLYNGRLYEELTIGGAVRPCNWFNFALSYSLINNGRYSNIGAGISLMPYDGINMTLAMDYIPMSFAAMEIDGKTRYCIPDRLSNLNIALGFSVVWGTNQKKGQRTKDKGIRTMDKEQRTKDN